MRFLLIGFVMCLVACEQTQAHFTPYSAQSVNLRKVVEYTIVAYRGDIPALVNAGGELVGSLDVNGNGFASADDVRSRALYEAAEIGGTHLLLASEGATTSWAKISPDTATTTVYGNTATTTVTPGAEMPVTKHHGAFLVVRVPPGRWLDLPVGLRPVPGRHFRGEYPGQQHVTGAPGSIDESPITAPQSASWSCSITQDGNDGVCFRGVQQCEAWRARLNQVATTPCTPTVQATCFSFEANGAPSMLCHPTTAACRSQRDYMFTRGERIIQECTPSQ